MKSIPKVFSEKEGLLLILTTVFTVVKMVTAPNMPPAERAKAGRAQAEAVVNEALS